MQSTTTNHRSAPRVSRPSLLAMGVLVVAAGLPVSGASGQNALGDGRALDNSLSRQGRYNQSRPSMREEFAFRNSIVTGNAPNGMSFRGDVGYLAPGDFRGQLGSNDLFSFRRDSLQSGIAGMGIRGTDALQYQLALTTGARPPANLVGRFSVNRSGVLPSSGDIGSLGAPGERDGLSQRPAIDPDADDRGTMLWMLRSPSAYMSNSSLQASSLRQVETESGVYNLTASPLRGVRLSPIPELTAARDAQRLARQQAESGETEERPFGRPDPDAAPRGTPDEGDPEAGQVRTMHGDIVTRIRRASEPDEEDVFATAMTIEERMTAMRRQLLGIGDDRLGGGAEGESGDADAEGSEGARPTGGGPVRFDSQTMQLLRGDGTPISQYVDPSAATRNVFAEHLAAGQDLMAKGRYFDAEERFATALGIRRGDVTAQMGRLHAQIGAGLYLSASLNIQALASSNPEVFGARYAPALLPSAQRLDEIIIVLSRLVDDSTQEARRASPQVRQSAGLLLGYLGFQLDRPELIERGMTSFLERATRGLIEGEPRPPEARVGDLLYQMWTTETNDG